MVQPITNELEKVTATRNITSLSQIQRYLDSSENIGKVLEFILTLFNQTNFTLRIKFFFFFTYLYLKIYFLTDVIVLAVDMLPTKEIYSSKNGTQQIQELIVIDKEYKSLLYE